MTAVNWKRVPCGSSVDEGLLFFYYLILRMRLFLPFLTVSRSVKHGSFHDRRTRLRSETISVSVRGNGRNWPFTFVSSSPRISTVRIPPGNDVFEPSLKRDVSIYIARPGRIFGSFLSKFQKNVFRPRPDMSVFRKFRSTSIRRQLGAR